MIYSKDNNFKESTITHSLSLQNAMQVPAPIWDENQLMRITKAGVGRGGLSGLSFDGTGFLGTGLFSGDMSTWGIGEIIFGVVGCYAIYAMFFQVKQTKYRMEIGAGRRRKSRAVSLRAKAKRLEEQTTGIF